MKTITGSDLKKLVLAEAKANAIPQGDSGLWTIRKYSLAGPVTLPKDGKLITVPPGNYTKLFRTTMATLHTYGECVMTDTPDELHKHLIFMLRAFGEVLITGLGLGCVARGALANHAVKSVTVIERDSSVLRLVRPYMPETNRLKIIEADAREWIKENVHHYDCAWHDLWSDPDKDEPHLQVTHAQLLHAGASHLKLQGAWDFPRDFRRLMREKAHVI